MISINWKPTTRELRLFAAVWFPAFFLLVGLLLGFRAGLWHIVLPLWATIAVISIVGVAKPPLIRPLFVGWMCAAFPIGFVVSHILLGLVFYLAITPLGLLARLLRRDKLNLGFDKNAETYWTPRPPAPPPERYFRQF